MSKEEQCLRYWIWPWGVARDPSIWEWYDGPYILVYVDICDNISISAKVIVNLQKLPLHKKLYLLFILFNNTGGREEFLWS